MLKIYSMQILGKLVFIGLLVCILGGCSTKQTSLNCPPVTLPDPPKPVVTDSGKHDISRYPDTAWVKPPKVDLKKQRASWSFQDIEKINNALTDWPAWGRSVEETISSYNEKVAGKEHKKKKSWYEFW